VDVNVKGTNLVGTTMAAARGQRAGHDARAATTSARAVYVRAADPEASLPGGRLVDEVLAELRRLAAGEESTPLDDLTTAAAAWSSDEAARFSSMVDGADGDEAAVLVRRTALACAPLSLLSGAWLQWLSDPSNADDADALLVLSTYAADVGVGHPGASRGSAYLGLLRMLHLSEYAVPAARLSVDRRVPDAAFYLPALLLAMSRRPDDFRAEILGADLCLRAVGLLPPLAAVRSVHPTGADWDAVDPGTARRPGAPSGLEQARAAVDRVAAAGAGDRAALGFAWALAALRRWTDGLAADLEAARDPAYEMAELLRLRAREGAIYHHDYDLEGRPLSEWLKDCRVDPQPLLGALGRSRLVKPGRSGASILVNRLISERGPMFRVFDPADVAVIRRWIDSLPVPGTATPPVDQGPPPLPPLALPSLDAERDDGTEPADIREAYHLLQSRTDTPALRRYAIAYVRGWLERSRHAIDRSDIQLPARWGTEGLRPWLAEQHDRHGREFEAGLEVPLPSREALVDSTVQLAPLTLIDGGWLRGFTDYGQAGSEIGFSLFETYWDELGNGETILNHPLIYREVLDEMGVHLPPTGSIEFARWPGFKDESFDLPVYWLSIGRFPTTFLPEVLGLNLAMELSGVGGSYRRARMALVAHGFSTRFVDIHNTIDNVASGHSAWAADAVDTYMASLPDADGPGGRAAAWDRVRAGYRSLNPPSTFWARHAGRRARRSSGRARRPSHVVDGLVRVQRRIRPVKTSSSDDLVAAVPASKGAAKWRT
jgi:Iron-containing redox enzyme